MKITILDKLTVLTMFICCSLCSIGQKKEFTITQLLNNKFPGVINPLPSVISWNDDGHLVLGRKVHPDSIAKSYLFDPKTVKEMLLKEDSAYKQKNGKHKSVYTKNDDLY
jgi:uncharacterized metal-binding protein